MPTVLLLLLVQLAWTILISETRCLAQTQTLTDSSPLPTVMSGAITGDLLRACNGGKSLHEHKHAIVCEQYTPMWQDNVLVVE
jgi:hypothetical protein